ncbi:MFS transporter [Leifsonia sp. F6_8S_P_1B]|uniref:MFS transporter n=1 Tax=Leifsonia williamsii TaxID=3035919 RepID=A0ABT8K9E0_9MICO|nr:MFS transporter [Leifsonia williamsii]MDN4614081.1 MFS transporter [Leifsonia williamsii]
MTFTDEAPRTGSLPARGSSAARPRRGSAALAVYVAAGLLLIAFNLRVGIASVSPVLSSLEHDLGGSPAAASLLTTIPVFAFGAFAFLTPALSRRIGLHRLLGVTMAAAALGIGLRLIPSPVALFAGTVVVGAAIAVANVCMPAAIKQDFAHRTASMMGLYSTAMFVGAAVATAFTVPLMADFGGSWRAALGFWLVPAAAALLVWLPRAAMNPGHVPHSTRVLDAVEELPDEPRMRRLLRDRVAWAVTGFMGTQSLTYYAALTWIPTLLRDAGVPDGEAGLMLSYTSLPGIAAALAVPALSRLRPPWLPIALSTACLIVGFTGLLLVTDGGAPWWWMTFLGLGQGSAIALSLSFIVLRSPDSRHTGHLSTMAQGIGYLLAGLGPVGLGIIHSATGGWSMPVGALLAVLVAQFAAGAAAARDRHVFSTGGARP